MKECLIIGKPNAGKTLFLINFAEFLGARELKLVKGWRGRGGAYEEFSLTLPRARALLVSAQPHTTRELQTVEVFLPRGKGKRHVSLTDTSGLVDGIHQDESVRRAMAKTFRAIHDADFILHLIDASKVGTSGAVEGMGELDYQIARYAPLQCRYAILANKIDLPWAGMGLMKLEKEFRDQRIFPVSALSRRGFKEVKSFVWSHL